MPNNSSSAKTYCTLREAFNLVGEAIFGREWQGFEADCDPAKAKQPTDTRSLLRKLNSDKGSYSNERRPVPARPLKGQDQARLEKAIERYTETLIEFLRLTNSGFVPTEFIPDNDPMVLEAINASSWPDPTSFDPESPDYRDLWFDMTADRVVLKPSDSSETPSRRFGGTSLWWAYGGRPGHVEIDREMLLKAMHQHVRSYARQKSLATTTARNTQIQEAAEDLWRKANENGVQLTKWEVAKQLLDNTDAHSLCRDLKNRAGGVLSLESLVRLISVPDWLPKRASRKKG